MHQHLMRTLIGMTAAFALAACQTNEPTTTEASAAAPTAPEFATVGELAPDFTLADANGKSHDLSDFRGKPVVLEWHNHDCPFVVKHYASGNMQKLQKEYAAKGVVWLTINSSAPGKQGHVSPEDALRLTADRNAAPAALLLDPSGEVGKRYRAKVTPHMFVIDGSGNLVYDGAIDDKRSTNQADVATAKNYVREALDAVLAGKEVATPRSEPYGCSVKYPN